MDETVLYPFGVVVVGVGHIHRDACTYDIRIQIGTRPCVPADVCDTRGFDRANRIPNHGQVVIAAVFHKEIVFANRKAVYRIIVLIIVPMHVRTRILVRVESNCIVGHLIPVRKADHVRECAVIDTKLYASGVLTGERGNLAQSGSRAGICRDEAQLRFHV